MHREKCWISEPSSISGDFRQEIKWNSTTNSSCDRSEHIEISRNFKHNPETPVKSAYLDTKTSREAQYKENGPDSVLQINQFGTFFPINSSPSPILERYLFESNSPILGLSSFMTNSDSPVLSQQQIVERGSPVLNSIRIKKKVRKLQIQRVPPDFIEPLMNKRELSDSSKYGDELITIEPIICSQDKESTDRSAGKELITIETTCSQKISTIDSEDDMITIEPICSQKLSKTDHPENELIKIEPICSQDSSSSSTVDQSVTLSGSSSAFQCYHQPKTRKKHCKPGGLLHQIQQTINLQASRLSLWHHDIYWKKANPSQFEYIQCHIKNYRKEYGCTIFECCDFDNGEQFLVCLGHNTTSALFDIEFVEIMKIFPPFKEKWIKLDNKNTRLYYNVTRILFDKMHKRINMSLRHHEEQNSV